MKLRVKRQNSLKETAEKDNLDMNNLKKNKKNCNKSSNREFSQIESNLTSYDNSKLDNENEPRYKPKLRNIDMNYPGKYKKMNSGKYLYKMKKPEKKPLNTKKKIYKYFDLNTVKIMVNFFNKLCDIEFEKMNSCKKKKIKKIDQITMKLISDDTLNSNLTTKNNFSEQKNNYINNSIFHYNKNINNKNKQEIPVIPLSSNIYYKLVYPNATNSITSLNEYNKTNQPQNLKKIFDQNMFQRMEPNTYEKTLVEMNSNAMYQNTNNNEKKHFPYNDYVYQPQKEIINKKTSNHITAANFIKLSQEDLMKTQCNMITTNSKSNELTAVKNTLVMKGTISLSFFDNLNSKNSTESEKSDEKLNLSANILDNSQKGNRSNCTLAKSYQCNVEDMTKNQLDQVNEIVKGKIEKDTSITSRKNSEKQQQIM